MFFSISVRKMRYCKDEQTDIQCLRMMRYLSFMVVITLVDSCFSVQMVSEDVKIVIDYQI